MTPEQRHREAVEAAREWQDEQRARVPELLDTSGVRCRLLWIDSGSGPGYEVLVPVDDQH